MKYHDNYSLSYKHFMFNLFVNKKLDNYSGLHREVNKNNLLGGQFLVFLPKNPGK